MSLRRKETAAVEMTAFAAGAGPPAKRIAALWMGDVFLVGAESVDAIGMSFLALRGDVAQ